MRPSNTTPVNGEEPSLDGGTGWTLAAILTVTVLDFFGASGSASSTSTDQTGSPFSLSMSWTFVSRVDFSKS